MKLRKPLTLIFRSVLCATMILGLAACSSDDDAPAADNGDMDMMEMEGDDDDGDDDAVQETVGEDGISNFVIPLSGEQEAPPVGSETAMGEGNLNIDRAAGTIEGSVSVSGLTGAATMAHIHQAFAGINGDVLFALTGNEDGSLWSVPDGTVLDAGQLAALAEGALYINVHTEANPGGEVRGQIIPEGILFEDSELSGDEEVPPVVSDASGVGVSTVNSESLAISATIFVDGLDDATMAHIHMAPEGENGDVIIGLEQDPGNPGIWRTPVPSSLTEEQLEAYEDEGLYFNVHSDDFPGGEIRGQL
ncbi:MAG: CHRD domain-containing protein [Granulosicoccus sp.]